MLAAVIALGLSSGAVSSRLTSASHEAALRSVTQAHKVGADAFLEASSDEAWGGASRLAVSALSSAAVREGRQSASAPGAGRPLNVLPFALPPMPPVMPAMLFGTHEQVLSPRDLQRSETAVENAFERMGSRFLSGQVGDVIEVDTLKYSPLQMRDLAMMDVLRGKAGIDGFISYKVDGSQVIVTKQKEFGTVTLGQTFKDLDRFDEGKVPYMPFSESLPILSEILRGVESMNSEDVVHLDLTGENAIALVPDAAGRRHALIRELGKSACINKDGQGSLFCAFSEQRPGSAVSRAPEGLATSNNVWQAGLIFAKMSLGVYPTDDVSTAYLQDAGKASEDETTDGRWRPQEKFKVGEYAPGFAEKYPEAAELIEGMLEPSPSKRWSAARALKATEALMAKYAVEGVSGK